ncbi:MAG: trypsin-like peptidase domain-containing protein, partial [bacterium]|nr:trypsin-like peptidase domain-containing protein [bacterium]
MTENARLYSRYTSKALAVLIINTILFFGLNSIGYNGFAQTTDPLYQLPPGINDLDEPFENQLSFSQVAARIIPTVVSIYCTKTISSSQLWERNILDNELWEFLGEKYFNISAPREFIQKGSGSGIIVSNNGFMLTNLHVVENAETIDVKLSDNRSFRARLVGADPLTELAVIKIEETQLPAAKLGNSDSVRIGDWVLAVGNPLELNSTVTAGIVSAIGREIKIIDDNFGVENFIQTDATINPGSSGGALVNLKGEVIGVNTAIATQSGFSQGYGFAIPINLARQIMKDLIGQGHVIRSYLGISMQDVDEKISRALGMEYPRGVFVDHVQEGSPAWFCGLKEKDILIKVDQIDVNKGNIIQSLIAQKKPGEQVLLTVIRKNRSFDVKVILGQRNGAKYSQSVNKAQQNFQNLGLQ